MSVYVLPRFEDASPTPVPGFSISLSPPQFGWIDFMMSAGSIVYTCTFSFVFDPFSKIRQFLERVAQGRSAELLIEDEGHQHFFRAGGNGADGMFRLGAWNTLALRKSEDDRYALTPVFDVLTNRGVFVASFNRAILAIWGKPTSEAFKRAWLNCSANDDPSAAEDAALLQLPAVQSPLLERYLTTLDLAG